MTNKLQRIAIYGPSNGGKSTLAMDLEKLLGHPAYHIDDLFWGPNWTETSTEELRKKVSRIVVKDRWIIDGNYSKIRPTILPRVTYAIILKPPLYLVLWRVFARTISRGTRIKLITPTPLPKEVINSGSAESLFEAIIILSKQAIKFYFKTYHKITRELDETIGKENYLTIHSKKELWFFLQTVANL